MSGSKRYWPSADQELRLTTLHSVKPGDLVVRKNGSMHWISLVLEVQREGKDPRTGVDRSGPHGTPTATVLILCYASKLDTPDVQLLSLNDYVARDSVVVRRPRQMTAGDLGAADEQRRTLQEVDP